MSVRRLQLSPVRSAIVIVTGVFLLVSAVRADQPSQQTQPVRIAHGSTQFRHLVNRIPARFEPVDNKRFVARGAGYAYLVEPTSATLMLAGKDNEAQTPNQTTITLSLVGANRGSFLEGENEIQGKSNYFVGSDPRGWRTNVVGYERVRVRSVYPDIDLVHYGNGQQLEYDFIVSPHGDPTRIRMRFNSGTNVAIDGKGDLLLQTPAGTLRHRAPRIHQERDGTQTVVHGRFVRYGRDIGFEIGPYDSSRELVIDPALAYGTYFDGTTYGTAVATVPASAGHKFVYVGGKTWGGLLLRDAFQPDSTKGMAFVEKYDVAQSGDASLIYSTYLGANSVWGLAVAADGSPVVVGDAGPNLPIVNAFMPQASTGYVLQLSAAGDLLRYSTYFPGQVRAIALDQLGRYDLAGENDPISRGDPPIPTTPGAVMPTPPSAPYLYSCWPQCSSANAFVAIIDPAQSGLPGLIYATYLGGSGADWANAVAVDAYGKLYVTGTTASLDFPIRNAAQTTLNATSYGCNDQGGLKTGQDTCGDMFLVKLNPTVSGSAELLYSTYLGFAAGEAIAVDAGGYVYLTGRGDSHFPTTPGAYQTTAQADAGQGATGGVIVVKIDPSASGAASLVYSTYVGGAGAWPVGLGVDSAGNVTIVGTAAANFPVRNDLNLRGFGLFESVDGGMSWAGLNNGASAIASLAIDPTVVPRTLYATSEGGVVKSLDGGSSWTPANQGLPYPVYTVSVDPVASNVVFVSTTNAIYRSVDRGATWQPSSLAAQSPWLAGVQQRGSGSGIYVGSVQGLYRSLDHGDSWQLIAGFPGWTVVVDDTTSPAVLYAAACCANGDGNSYVFRSVDDGQSWTTVLSVVAGFGGIAAIAVDRTTTPAVIYAAGVNPDDLNFQLWRSSDGGNTWDTVEDSNALLTPNPQFLGNPLLVTDESSVPAALYLGTQSNGVWKSTDRGVTWAKVIPTGAYASQISPGIELFVDHTDSFPATVYAALSSSAGGGDFFITKLNARGTDLISSAVVGGFNNDAALGAVVDPDGGVYITGATNWPNNLPVPNAFANAASSSNPGFLLAFGPAVTAPPPTCSSNCDVTLSLQTQSGAIAITLPGVSTPGVTTVSTVDDQTLANLSLSNNLGSWDISTTAAYSGGPAILCFTILSVNDPTVFANVRIWHVVDGVPQDATISHDFPTRQVCASVTSFSPFVAILGPQTPTLIWATPASILYGTALGGTQLNATASVPGTFVYSPSPGAVLTAGVRSLSVTFTPLDLIRYAPTTATVLLTVSQAAPVLTWPNPAPLTLGTPLGSAQLNAAANVTGSFAYIPAPGTVLPVGSQTLTGTFTPNDAGDYTRATASVPLSVTYNVCPLYDQAQAVKSGATIPIKLALCDVTGSDRSSSSIVVKASGVTLVSNNASGTLIDPGNSNPDSDFRFDSTLGSTGGYIFNLKTTGLGTGTYALTFGVSGDPIRHSVQFQVK